MIATNNTIPFVKPLKFSILSSLIYFRTAKSNGNTIRHFRQA